MPRKKVPYNVGDWFAVPLEGGGYAIGKIVQADLKGGITGYFFGPRRSTVPSLPELRDLHHDDAIHVANFGDLGLVEGEWPVIGGHDAIEALRDWPTPTFGRLQNPPPKGWRVTYRDDDTNEPASIEPVSVEDCLALPNDVVSGAGAIQAILSRRISGLDIPDRRRQAVESWVQRQ